MAPVTHPGAARATWSLARQTYANLFSDHPEPLRAMQLDAYINEVKGRHLRNLALQERRLRNARQHDLEELEQLQSERRKKREKQLEAAAKMCERYKEEEWDFDPAQFGFEFSIEQIEEKVAWFQALRLGCEYPQQYAKYIGNKILKCERMGLNPEDYTDPADFERKVAWRRSDLLLVGVQVAL
ncbi:MAG TPA: hypothetical protein VKX25_04790 [Bryobacteraceae bacterium]|jgi:hypothetical protein|nr:hypothetical protein [Bryobacteraceae bacterium]